MLFCSLSLFAPQRHYDLSLKQEHYKGEREHYYFLHLNNSTVPGHPGHVVILDTLCFRGQNQSAKDLESWQSYEHIEDAQHKETPDSMRLCMCVCICVHWRQMEGNINLLKGPPDSRLKMLYSPATKSRIIIKKQIQAQN